MLEYTEWRKLRQFWRRSRPSCGLYATWTNDNGMGFIGVSRFLFQYLAASCFRLCDSDGIILHRDNNGLLSLWVCIMLFLLYSLPSVDCYSYMTLGIALILPWHRKLSRYNFNGKPSNPRGRISIAFLVFKKFTSFLSGCLSGVDGSRRLLWYFILLHRSCFLYLTLFVYVCYCSCILLRRSLVLSFAW